MTTDTTRHIEAMGHTARALEELGRKIGYYSRDCDTLATALKTGKSGFVVLFDSDEDAEPEVHAIGASKAKVKIEKGNSPDDWSVSYQPLHEEELAKRVASGKSVREKHETLTPMHVSDERRAQMSSDAKAERKATCDKIAAIAQANKQFWANKQTA